MTKLTKKEIRILPKYIRFGEKGSAMRLQVAEEGRFGWDNEDVIYYRDAGDWWVGIRIEETSNKVFSINRYSDTPWLHDVELIPTTYKDWKNDNAPYLLKGAKAFSFK